MCDRSRFFRFDIPILRNGAPKILDKTHTNRLTLYVPFVLPTSSFVFQFLSGGFRISYKSFNFSTYCPLHDLHHHLEEFGCVVSGISHVGNSVGSNNIAPTGPSHLVACKTKQSGPKRGVESVDISDKFSISSYTTSSSALFDFIICACLRQYNTDCTNS